MGVLNKYTVDFEGYYAAFVDLMLFESSYEDAGSPYLDRRKVRKYYNEGCDTDEAVSNYINEGNFE